MPKFFAEQLSLHIAAAPKGRLQKQCDESDASSDGDNDNASSRTSYKMLVKIHALQLSFMLKDQDQLATACAHAQWLGSNVDTSVDQAYFIGESFQKKDSSRIHVPKHATLYRDHIKLDCMLMHWEQGAFLRAEKQGCELFFYITPDSSPQGQYNYFLMREETVTINMQEPLQKPMTLRTLKMDAEEHPMPCTVLGKTNVDTTAKWSKLHHSAQLSHGLVIGQRRFLDLWRLSCRGVNADQGTETKMKFVPAVHDSDHAEKVEEAINALRRGERKFEHVQDLLYFPRILGISDHCHIYWGALKRAVEELPEWPQHNKGLTSLCHTFGDRSRSEWFVNHCMKNASEAQRRLIMCFHQHHVDWRWETLEDLEESLNYVYPVAKKFFCPVLCASLPDKDYKDGLLEAMASSDFPVVGKCVGLAAKAVGREIRVLLGCRCHAHILTAYKTYAERAKAMSQATGRPDGKCGWKGKWGPPLALGLWRKQAQLDIRGRAANRFRRFWAK